MPKNLLKYYIYIYSFKCMNVLCIYRERIRNKCKFSYVYDVRKHVITSNSVSRFNKKFCGYRLFMSNIICILTIWLYYMHLRLFGLTVYMSLCVMITKLISYLVVSALSYPSQLSVEVGRPIYRSVYAESEKFHKVT